MLVDIEQPDSLKRFHERREKNRFQGIIRLFALCARDGSGSSFAKEMKRNQGGPKVRPDDQVGEIMRREFGYWL